MAMDAGKRRERRSGSRVDLDILEHLGVDGDAVLVFLRQSAILEDVQAQAARAAVEPADMICTLRVKPQEIASSPIVASSSPSSGLLQDRCTKTCLTRLWRVTYGCGKCSHRQRKDLSFVPP